MSFSFSYDADTPAAAKALLANHPEAPESVRSFIVEALAGIMEALGDVPVNVSASGHLCTGKGSSPDCTASLYVAPTSR
jgi:hypothetical protein